MTTDYFAALASRAIHPEQGIQPRGRTMFDASDPDVREPGPVEIATEASVEGIDIPAAPGSQRGPHVRRLASAEPDPGTPSHQPRELEPERAQAPTVSRPASAHAVPPGPPRAVSVPADVAPRPRPVVDIAPHVRRTGDEGTRETGASHRADVGTEPIVRVHIGRVDVRAVVQPPAAPPSSRRSKEALMSLEDYVRQRKDGRP
jgi:hypothetical protein